MKKSSILVTLFLVVALVFAVSCPDKNPAINVTTESPTVANVKDGDLTLEVKITLANDTFNAETVKDNEPVDKWIKSFKDSTNIVKANVKSATVKANSVNAAKDEVTVTLVVEPKVVTATNDPVKIVFEIPEAKEASDTVWTTSKKAIAEAKANSIAITVVDKDAVTAVVGGESAEFTVGTADTTGKKVTVTLDGGTFANTNGIAVAQPNGATAAHLTYAYDDASDKKVLTITVKATADIASADQGTYKINIPASAITADDTHVAKAISKDFTVTVTVPAPAQKKQLAQPIVGGTQEISSVAGAECNASVTYTLGEGATWKDGLTKDKFTFSSSLPNGISVESSFDSPRKILTLKFNGVSATAQSKADYSFAINEALIDFDANSYEIPTGGLKGTFSITITGSGS